MVAVFRGFIFLLLLSAFVGCSTGVKTPDVDSRAPSSQSSCPPVGKGYWTLDVRGMKSTKEVEIISVKPSSGFAIVRVKRMFGYSDPQEVSCFDLSAAAAD